MEVRRIVSTKSLVAIDKRVVFRTIGEDTFVSSNVPGYSSQHLLTGVSSFVWSLINEENKVGEIVQGVCSEFVGAGEEQVEKDILDLLQQLFSQGLIQIDGQMMEPSQLPRQVDNLRKFEAAENGFKFWSYVAERCIPLKVVIELTSECNIHCSYCYARREYEAISFSQAKSILDQIAEASCLFLTLTGGEPLTNKDCLDIMQYANEKAFSIRLLTNGTLITPKVADRIQTADHTAVDVTVFGAAAITHDNFTHVKGSFNATIRGIKLLVARGVRTSMKVVAMNFNFPEMNRMRQLAERLGVEVNFSALVYPRINTSLEPLRYRVDDEQLKQLMLDGLYLPSPDPCGAGRNKCVISPTGEVYPCEFARIHVGDLKNQTFAEIWRSDELQKIRDQKMFECPDTCLNCPFRKNCPRCPAMAYLEDGNIVGKSSEACRIARLYFSIK